MPYYHFKCQSCEQDFELLMNVSEYVEFKNENTPCPGDCDGSLEQEIGTVWGKVYRTSEELKEKIDEDVRKIVEKVRAGDENLMRNLYGDTPDDESDF